MNRAMSSAAICGSFIVSCASKFSVWPCGFRTVINRFT